jgi:hypothetical protein
MNKIYVLLGSKTPSGPWNFININCYGWDMETLEHTEYRYYKVDEVWEWPF